MLLVYTIKLLVLNRCIKSADFSLLTFPVYQFLIPASPSSDIHSLSYIVFIRHTTLALELDTRWVCDRTTLLNASSASLST